MNLEKNISELAQRARAASASLVALSSAKKNDVLQTIIEMLVIEKTGLQHENEKDLKAGAEKGLSAAMLDRLKLSDSVLDSMVSGLQDLLNLPDPVGSVDGLKLRPNGLQVGRMRVPLGVIAMIYESRPNVTIDAAALCLKAGNAIILRGGSEAIHSNLALTAILKKALSLNGLDEEAVQIVPVVDREAILYLLQQEENIDLVIPRGGEGLIRFVTRNSQIPVLKHYKGVCHIYVDEDADLAKAARIIVNAKTSRPGVCNALEGLLVHEKVASNFVPAIAELLVAEGVTIKGCAPSSSMSHHIVPASENDWGTEFLDLTMCLRIVNSFSAAADYILQFGSRHTEVIITENYSTARRFISEVDASAVMVNASTRFNDGGQLGLGAEIGISTTKLHAYGPMGLEELTTRKFVVFGSGQVRE
jgi:glutamate-5-semialdehyde dehydrogenase